MSNIKIMEKEAINITASHANNSGLILNKNL